MVDILIENGTIVTMDDERRIIMDGAIAIDNGLILEVNKTNKIKGRYKADEKIDAKNKVVLPGLIDAHLHTTGEPLYRGLIPDNIPSPRTIHEWLTPMHAVETAEEEYLSALFAFIGCIKTGTTCFCEAGSIKSVGSVVKAMDEIGIRGTLGRWTWDIPKKPDVFSQSTDQALESMESTIKEFDGKLNGRVRVWASLIGHTTCSDELLVEAKKLADSYGVGVNMHMASNIDNIEGYLKKTGKRPVKHFYDLGILDSNLQLVHMIHTNMDDIDLLAKNDVKIVSCPALGLKRGKGITKVGMIPEMVQKGICVGLGCDGPNASDYLDMVRIIYLAAGLFKDCRMNINLFPAEKALEMGTVDGAKTLLMDDEIGSLQNGKKADIILFDTKRPEWLPIHNVVNSLVYSADGNSVDTVIIDGEIIMKDRKILTVDEFEVYDEVQKKVEKIVERAKFPRITRWKIC